MDNIDWTQYLVPVEEDLVTLPTVKEYAARADQLNAKLVTDFARENVVSARPASDYRDREHRHGAYWLQNGWRGGDNSACEANVISTFDCKVGLAPCVRLQLPQDYTLPQIKAMFDLTEHKVRFGKRLYQAAVGEYPQSRVNDKELAAALERHFANPDAQSEQFQCTGRMFSPVCGGSQSFYSQHRPEYQYRGEKFVRVHDINGVAWYKVEPIRFWVKNSAAVRRGKAKTLDLEATKVLLPGIPFQPNERIRDYQKSWQDSLVRAYLNSAQTNTRWDYRQTGFLQQALNPNFKPTIYTVPACENELDNSAFEGCRGLEKIVIPSSVHHFFSQPFFKCDQAQLWFEICDSGLMRDINSRLGLQPRYVHLPRNLDGKWIVFAPAPDQTLAADYFCFPMRCQEKRPNHFLRELNYLMDANFRENLIKFAKSAEQQATSFIPLGPVLKIFPTQKFDNFFCNGNQKRWKQLVDGLHLNLIDEFEMNWSMQDLMKIYYALGGFSPREAESVEAFRYVSQYVAVVPKDQQRVDALLQQVYKQEVLRNPQVRQAYIIANEIHSRFSGLELYPEHNPTFARFFMRYYHQNPDFMCFRLDGTEENDYLCAAHNNFARILQDFPNRVVNGNTQRELLGPRFVAEHSHDVEYQNVAPENQHLAQFVRHYGFTQREFNVIQNVYNQAKAVQATGQCVLRADAAPAANVISFRVLAKDDPLGFVLGNITNCCQRISGAAETCVHDGYTNPHAGFLVFESNINDYQQVTDHQRVIAQAYVWYDPETRTVCYDNIEIPKKIMNTLQKGPGQLCMAALEQAVTDSAEAIMRAMNRHGVAVERVTMGKKYNNLSSLNEHYRLTRDPAVHRNYQGYSDAKEQYIIRTADQMSTKLTTMAANTAPHLLKVPQMCECEYHR